MRRKGLPPTSGIASGATTYPPGKVPHFENGAWCGRATTIQQVHDDGPSPERRMRLPGEKKGRGAKT
jgi:hypothetical protein